MTTGSLVPNGATIDVWTSGIARVQRMLALKSIAFDWWARIATGCAHARCERRATEVEVVVHVLIRMLELGRPIRPHHLTSDGVGAIAPAFRVRATHRRRVELSTTGPGPSHRRPTTQP